MTIREAQKRYWRDMTLFVLVLFTATVVIVSMAYQSRKESSHKHIVATAAYYTVAGDTLIFEFDGTYLHVAMPKNETGTVAMSPWGQR